MNFTIPCNERNLSMSTCARDVVVKTPYKRSVETCHKETMRVTHSKHFYFHIVTNSAWSSQSICVFILVGSLP